MRPHHPYESIPGYEAPRRLPRPRLRDAWWWGEYRDFLPSPAAGAINLTAALMTGFAGFVRRVPPEWSETYFRTVDTRGSMAAGHSHVPARGG